MQTANLSYYLQAFGPVDPAVTMSGNGRQLAYATYTGSNRYADIVLADTATGAWRVLGGTPAGSHNYAPAMAAAGGMLAFTTLAPGAAGIEQIAVSLLAGGMLQFASSSASGQPGNGASRAASLSADGRYVAFTSAASNLVAGDSNDADDVFVKDLQTGAVQRVSLDAGGRQLDAHAAGARMSDNGAVVLFQSSAQVIDGVAAQAMQLYARELASGMLSLVAPGTVEHAAVSADGRYVVFTSAARFGADSDNHIDVFRKDLASGELTLVSVGAGGGQGSGIAAAPSISADGRFVSFSYDGNDLLPGAAGSNSQVYVKDMASGELVQASSGSEAGQGSYAASLSGDGASLAWVRYAGTVGADYDVAWDVLTAVISGVQYLPAPTVVAPATAPLPATAIAGGSGLDTRAYPGALADYSIAASGGAVQVRPLAAAAVDALTSIERLQFADTMFALDTGAQGIAGQAYRIYQAAFARVPDAEGLGFWIHALDGGLGVERVAAGFVASAEFAALYAGAQGNAGIVARLYANVLDRPGEAAGITFWTSVLDRQQASLAQVLAAFSESPENVAALVGVLEHGIAYLPFG